MPLLPPRLLALLDALHLRIPLRTAVFGTIDFYRRLKIPFIRRTIRRLEAKKRAELAATGRKIKVCILCLDKSQWGMQSIYDAMATSPRFEPYVLACPNWIRHGETAPQQDTVQFLLRKHISVRTDLVEGDFPDIVLAPMFYSNGFGPAINFHKLYKRALLGCVLYSWTISDSDKYFFGSPEITYFWRQYLFNERENEAAAHYSPIKGRNTRCVGFPRSDDFVAAQTSCPIWENKDSIKVIWAPHWSIKTHSKLGNFDRYAESMLKWLSIHPNYEIVLKPHPLLRARLTDGITQKKLGINGETAFDTPESYDNFLQRWDSLPNGHVMNSGDYYSLFKSSNAIILDSISFIAEYMPTGHPMCFCNRDRSPTELKSVFNELGRDLLPCMNIAESWGNIQDFLIALSEKHHQEKNPIRDTMILKHLSLNVGHVGQSIKKEIESSLFG